MANIEGAPLSFIRNGQRQKVLEIYNHWRVIDEWWGDEVQRDYFRIEIDRGLVYDVYHDMIGDHWYLNKIQDWGR